MTNINCSFNCIHQKDGKCCLTNTTGQVFGNKNCGYFKDILQNKENKC